MPHIQTLELNSETGKFVLEPLERGFGQTIGNALRRVLLSQIQGAAITAIKSTKTTAVTATAATASREMTDTTQRGEIREGAVSTDAARTAAAAASGQRPAS